MRAGSIKMALSSENTPTKVIPSRRNGSEINQMTGARKSASSASGQLTTNRISQETNRMSGFISHNIQKTRAAVPATRVPKIT